MLLIELLARQLVNALNDEAIVHGDAVQRLTAELDVELTDLLMQRIKHVEEIAAVAETMQVDDAPMLNVCPNGVWVGAWFWVSKDLT